VEKVRWSMKRTGTVVILALVVGMIVGTFLIAPLMSRPAVAQEKKPAVGKGKCVGVVVISQRKDNTLVCRTFEDGTVEFRVVLWGGFGTPPTWAP
jgi:hypothetical protein